MHLAIRASFPNLTESKIPIDICDLARSRNVVGIFARKLDGDGTISTNETGGYLIEVNKEHSGQRQRFTIAHEIGHTFFFDLEECQVEPRFRIQDDDLGATRRQKAEEYLCNYAAAELLMPQFLFAAHVRERGPSSANMLGAARAFDVSLHACAWRMLQVLPLNLVVIRWEYDPTVRAYKTRWIVRRTRRVGLPKPELRLSSNDPLFSIFQEYTQFRGRVWVSLDGPLDDYFMDATIIRNGDRRSFLSVFALERNPSLLFRDKCQSTRTVDQAPLF